MGKEGLGTRSNTAVSLISFSNGMNSSCDIGPLPYFHYYLRVSYRNRLYTVVKYVE